MGGVARSPTYHVVTREQLLQELCLLVHHCLDDELIIACDVEQGAAGTGVRQLNQGLVAQRVLKNHGWAVSRQEGHGELHIPMMVEDPRADLWLLTVRNGSCGWAGG